MAANYDYTLEMVGYVERLTWSEAESLDDAAHKVWDEWHGLGFDHATVYDDDKSVYLYLRAASFEEAVNPMNHSVAEMSLDSDAPTLNPFRNPEMDWIHGWNRW